MTGCLRSPLPKVFDFIQRKIVTRQIEQRVEQHAAMTRGQEKPIAIFPFGIARVVPHELCPKRVSHRRGPQRQTRMSGLRFLDCINSQRANCVDAKLIEFGRAVGFLLHSGAHD